MVATAKFIDTSELEKEGLAIPALVIDTIFIRLVEPEAETTSTAFARDLFV